MFLLAYIYRSFSFLAPLLLGIAFHVVSVASLANGEENQFSQFSDIGFESEFPVSGSIESEQIKAKTAYNRCFSRIPGSRRGCAIIPRPAHQSFVARRTLLKHSATLITALLPNNYGRLSRSRATSKMYFPPHFSAPRLLPLLC